MFATIILIGHISKLMELKKKRAFTLMSPLGVRISAINGPHLDVDARVKKVT